MYDHEDIGTFVKDTLEAEVLKLRAKIRQLPDQSLLAYLQASALDTSANAQVMRLLVLQARNANAANARRLGK